MIRKSIIYMFVLSVIIGLVTCFVIRTHRQPQFENNSNVVSPKLSASSSRHLPSKKHDGPQTVEALLKSFEDMAGNSVVDEKYPQVEWLEMLLDKGIVIEDYNDYSGYMVARNALVQLETQPEMWTSDVFGIPPTTDWETFKAAYIERKIWEYDQLRAAKQIDPDVNGGLFTGPDMEIFLPAKPGRVYVKRVQETGAMFFGESLDKAQEFDLLHKGIEPQGYEVIYIDENGEHLAEAPPPISREVLIERLTLPPDGWMPPEGWTPPPWMEPALRAKGWTGTFFPQEDTTRQLSSTAEEYSVSVGSSHIQDETAQMTHTHPEASAHLQPVSDSNKTLEPAELEKLLIHITGDAELEKQFIPDMPELPTEERMEAALHKQFQPQRLARAIETLNRYGPEEGLRRLKESDPEIAEQIRKTRQRKDSMQQD